MSAQAMPAALQFPPDRFITVKLAVHDDARATVLALHRLVPRYKVDDAEPRVSKRDSPVRCDPMPLSVRAAMKEALCCPLHDRGPDRITTREERNNAAHPGGLLIEFGTLSCSAPNASTRSRELYARLAHRPLTTHAHHLFKWASYLAV